MVNRLKQILGDVFGRATKTLQPHWQTLRPRLFYFGLAFLLPWLLFPGLALTSGAQWWQWDAWVIRTLLILMVVFAIVFGAVYSLLAMVLIIGIWCDKVKIARHKQVRMQFNYLSVPVLFGLIAAWGWTCLAGHSNRFLLHCGLSVYFGWYVANMVLYVFERRGAKLSVV